MAKVTNLGSHENQPNVWTGVEGSDGHMLHVEAAVCTRQHRLDADHLRPALVAASRLPHHTALNCTPVKRSLHCSPMKGYLPYQPFSGIDKGNI